MTIKLFGKINKEDWAHKRHIFVFFIVSLLVLRILVGIAFPFLFINGSRLVLWLAYSAAVVGDAVDGILGRQMDPPIKLNAYSDPVADFILVSGAFIAFVLDDKYPLWIIFIVIAMFAQFIGSSKIYPIYDPLGKYYGVFLFGWVTLSMLLQGQAALLLLLYLLCIASTLVLISRVVFLLQCRT